VPARSRNPKKKVWLKILRMRSDCHNGQNGHALSAFTSIWPIMEEDAIRSGCFVLRVGLADSLTFGS
jgi:hypothetical protein